MLQYRRTISPLPEFSSPGRQPGFVVFCMVALALCATVSFSLTGATRAYGAEPLRFAPPPVDTTASRSQTTAPASTEAPPAENFTESDAGDVPAANAENDTKDGARVVHLFNTADMFRKPIAGNTPQWERVTNDVKKKASLSRLIA